MQTVGFGNISGGIGELGSRFRQSLYVCAASRESVAVQGAASATGCPVSWRVRRRRTSSRSDSDAALPIQSSAAMSEFLSIALARQDKSPIQQIKTCSAVHLPLQ